jgi:hypothetical protein
MIASTYKSSGIYAISLTSGQRIWSRLGDKFDWLRRCFDILCDDVGDAPTRIWNGGLLTRSGRLLNAETGKIVSRHRIEYLNTIRTLMKIDGNSVTPTYTFRERESFDLYRKQDTSKVSILLANLGLSISSWRTPCVTAYGLMICIACEVPAEFLHEPDQRFSVGRSHQDIPHHLVVCDESGATIIARFGLGNFFAGEIDWADNSVLSVTMQTVRQWNWTYKREMWLLEWKTLKDRFSNK